MKILCIDDAQVVRNAIVHEVKKLGHECDEAEDAFEGKQMLQSGIYNLVFLDVNMPGKTGIEMLAELNEEKVQYAPVVMLTTEASEEMKKLGKSLGVKAWVVKPLNNDMVKIIIEKMASKNE